MTNRRRLGCMKKILATAWAVLALILIVLLMITTTGRTVLGVSNPLWFAIALVAAVVGFSATIRTGNEPRPQREPEAHQ